jgi:hypothetical protein
MSASRDYAAETSSGSEVELTAFSSSAKVFFLPSESGLASTFSIAWAASLSWPNFFLNRRFQALVGVSDGRLGGILGSGHGPSGEGGDDSVRDNIGCHGGCNCAIDPHRTEWGIGTSWPRFP